MSAICEDCGTEYHRFTVPPQIVMLKDKIWLSIAKMPDVLCATCIEKRLGRAIIKEDLKESDFGPGMIPCNHDYWSYQMSKEKRMAKTNIKI